MLHGKLGMINKHFWKGKKVFITGHTGFKGGWLSLLLQELGVNLKGYALEADTEPSLFQVANVSSGMTSVIGDIRDSAKLKKEIKEFEPEVVIHMAAQPLVRRSYNEPVETYETNVMGTVYLLEACRSVDSIRSIVNVTTDKCYENNEWVWGYREIDPMGGHDPYSSSKGCAELVSSAYRRSFFSSDDSPGVGTARAGNVVGGGDWCDDRLVPDIFKAIINERSVIIRNPLATRPWQFVLEPLSGYLLLAEKLYSEKKKFQGAWNFGPKDDDVKSVECVLGLIDQKSKNGISWELDKNSQPHEARLLKLDISKAEAYLDWHPNWSLSFTVEKIVEWYEAYTLNSNMREFTLKQISEYLSSCDKRRLS